MEFLFIFTYLLLDEKPSVVQGILCTRAVITLLPCHGWKGASCNVSLQDDSRHVGN
jgi:hypothetical protein